MTEYESRIHSVLADICQDIGCDFLIVARRLRVEVVCSLWRAMVLRARRKWNPLPQCPQHHSADLREVYTLRQQGLNSSTTVFDSLSGHAAPASRARAFTLKASGSAYVVKPWRDSSVSYSWISTGRWQSGGKEAMARWRRKVSTYMRTDPALGCCTRASAILVHKQWVLENTAENVRRASEGPRVVDLIVVDSRQAPSHPVVLVTIALVVQVMRKPIDAHTFQDDTVISEALRIQSTHSSISSLQDTHWWVGLYTPATSGTSASHCRFFLSERAFPVRGEPFVNGCAALIDVREPIAPSSYRVLRSTAWLLQVLIQSVGSDDVKASAMSLAVCGIIPVLMKIRSHRKKMAKAHNEADGLGKAASKETSQQRKKTS